MFLCYYSENSTVAIRRRRDTPSSMWNEHVFFLNRDRLSVNRSFVVLQLCEDAVISGFHVVPGVLA